jgi:CHASE2 domain-containing sensor protein
MFRSFIRLPARAWRILRPASDEEHGRLWRVLVRSLPLVLTLSLLSHYLSVHGWFSGLETFSLDSLLRLNVPGQSDAIVLVTIDDDDYSRHFRGTSPLDARTLFKVVDLILQAGPKVLGVDIDTEHESFSTDRNFPSNVVWARTAQPAEEGDAPTDDARAMKGPLKAAPFLGGGGSTVAASHPTTPAPKSGIVLLPCDSDGVVRRYWRYVNAVADGEDRQESAPMCSFCWLIAQEYRSIADEAKKGGNTRHAVAETGGKALHDVDELPIINFGSGQRRFQKIPLSKLLANPRFAEPGSSPLHDRIVLLGGRYKAARDEYWTPVGRMHGVELIAEITAAELDGDFLTPVNHKVAFLIDIAFAELLLCFYWRFSGWWVSYVNLLLLPLMCLAGSFLAFRAVAYWFNFAPVLFGARVHWQWEQSHELKHLRRQVARLEGTSAMKQRDS